MNALLESIQENCVYPFNPIIAEGVSVHQMEGAIKHIENALILSSHSFPPQLKYEGIRPCTPEEEYQYISFKRNQQHTLELAPSNIYMVNLMFSWDGVMLPPKPVFIPYVDKAGIIYLRGKKFTVLPVLADETLSVAKGDIFVPFLSAKITFKRKQYWFKMNGVQKVEYLVYSKIHHHDPAKQPRRSTRANNSVKCDHTMAHYLFGKYGVKRVFKMYCNADIEIIEGPVDYNKYPEDKYTVCTSSQIRPRSVKNRNNYVPTDIKIIIENNKLGTGALGLICGFFYVLDHYPDRFSAEYFDNSEDELRLWRVILGHAIFRNNDNEGTLYNSVNEHYDSLDLYMDDMTKEGLTSEGYPVENLWDLMARLIFDFTEIILNTDASSMYGKKLEVLRYVLADIVKAVSIFKYKISSIKNREFTYNDISKYLSRYIKPEVIFNGLNKKHNEIVSVPSAGDNIMFNHTSRLILQENATGSTRGKRKTAVSFKDPSRLLHTSIAVCGSILALPKAEPTGKVVLNPCCPLDKSYKLKCPPEFKKQLDQIQRDISQG